MSHYVNIVTQIKDLKALIRALGRLGFDQSKIEVYETAKPLIGYQGDSRSQKANVILRRKYVGSSSNDIGFERMSDGRYAAHISEFDQGTGTYASHEGKYGKTWQGKLNAYYGLEKAKMEYDKKGLKYFEDVDDKERPRLRVKI
jgi:hypothetical protein